MTQAEHAELLASIMMTYSRGNVRLMRANAGQGWAGRIVEKNERRIVLSPYRPFHGMHAGVLDLIGWRGERFVAIEGKTGTARLTPEQKGFMELVLSCGGLAGEARSVEDAGRILEGL